MTMGYWKKHFSSKHLDSGDIPEGTQPLIKITGIGDAPPDENDGQKKMRITFKPSQAITDHMKANNTPIKTTWDCSLTIGYQLAAMFGEDDAKWIGRMVNVYAAPIKDGYAVRIFGSPEIDRDISIRVRDFGGKKTWTMKSTKPAATGAQS